MFKELHFGKGMDEEQWFYNMLHVKKSHRSSGMYGWEFNNRKGWKWERNYLITYPIPQALLLNPLLVDFTCPCLFGCLRWTGGDEPAARFEQRFAWFFFRGGGMSRWVYWPRMGSKWNALGKGGTWRYGRVHLVEIHFDVVFLQEQHTNPMEDQLQLQNASLLP